MSCRPLIVFTAGLVLGLFAVAGPGRTQEINTIDNAEEYRACMLLARKAPREALESAQVWEDQGGGSAARHCYAVALLALGQYSDAGTRFEELAAELTGEEARLRADALAQAGQAWLLGDQMERAYAAQSSALELAPKNVELWIDRAMTAAISQNYWEAIDDLNEAENLAPERPDIFIFRASAYRYVDALDLAKEDIARGLELDPNNAEALLERGILRRLTGDPEGARADWLKVVSLIQNTPAAEAAQANLEALDVKAE